MPDEPAEAHNNNANLLADYMFPMATETDSMHRAAQLLDFTSLVTDSTSSTAMAPGHFSTTGAEYANPKPWVLGSLFGANHNSDATDMGRCWALNGEGECTCHAGVTELLASMRRGGSSNDQRLSLDAQLAKLKQCIVSSGRAVLGTVVLVQGETVGGNLLVAVFARLDDVPKLVEVLTAGSFARHAYDGDGAFSDTFARRLGCQVIID